MTDLVQFRITGRTKFAQLSEHLKALPPRERSEWLRQAALDRLGGSELELLKQLVEQSDKQLGLLNTIIGLLEKKKGKRKQQ
jgi:hypothetical protein